MFSEAREKSALLRPRLSAGQAGSLERHHGKYFAACTLAMREQSNLEAQTAIAEPYETVRATILARASWRLQRARSRGLADIGIRRRLEY